MRGLSHDFADATAGVPEAHEIHTCLAMVTDSIVYDAPSLSCACHRVRRTAIWEMFEASFIQSACLPIKRADLRKPHKAFFHSNMAKYEL